MTNEIINRMIEEINGWIKLAHIEFEKNGRSEWYQRTYDRICGMIKMLTIATGEEFYFDETGVHKRATA